METREAKPTREKLLEAAGSLFLEKGYDGVSIRDVTEAAGANVASVNYYFGGKENLYREVFRRKLGQKARDVIEALETVIAEDDPPDLRKVIDTYVSSFLSEVLSSGDAQNFLRLVSQEMSEQGIASDIFLNEAVMPIHKLMREAILKARPGIPGEKASLCIASLAGQVLHFIRAKDVIKHTIGRSYDRKLIDDITKHITEFSLRGIGE